MSASGTGSERPGRVRATLKFWLRDIWRPDWDAHRRGLLLRHYLAYVRNRDIPGEHLPRGLGRAGDPDLEAQRVFSEAFAARITRVQDAADAPVVPVHLTYRPLGKNLRLLGTALRVEAGRGRRVAIHAEGMPSEVRMLTGRGHDWSPWLWIRNGTTDDIAPRHAAQAWNLLFRHPPARVAEEGDERPSPAGGKVARRKATAAGDEGPGGSRGPGLGERPRLASGAGVFDRRFLQTVLEVAAATRYAFEPADPIRARIEALKREADWPADVPVLGIHVRRGDAASAEAGTEAPARATRKSFPLATYLETADRLCTRYGIRDIFLATESGEEIERARSLRPQYRFLWMDYDRSLFPNIETSNQFIEDLSLEHPERARALAETAILDLAFFRECHAFVGAFNSEFSVLAWLLTVGSRGHLVPHVSLSKPAEGRSLNPFDALLNLRNNCPLELHHW